MDMCVDVVSTMAQNVFMWRCCHNHGVESGGAVTTWTVCHVIGHFLTTPDYIGSWSQPLQQCARFVCPKTFLIWMMLPETTTNIVVQNHTSFKVAKRGTSYPAWNCHQKFRNSLNSTPISMHTTRIHTIQGQARLPKHQNTQVATACPPEPHKQCIMGPSSISLSIYVCIYIHAQVQLSVPMNRHIYTYIYYIYVYICIPQIHV